MITGSAVKGVLDDGARVSRCRIGIDVGQRPGALHLRVGQSDRRHRAPAPSSSGCSASPRSSPTSRRCRQKHARRRAHPRLVAHGGGLAASWRPILRGSGSASCSAGPGGGPVTASFMSYALETAPVRDTATASARARSKASPARNRPTTPPSPAASSRVLSLGIPSNAVTALLLGALGHPRHPAGPLFITQRPDLFWGVVASMYVGNVLLLMLNLPLVGLWVQLLRVPYRVLFPLVLLLVRRRHLLGQQERVRPVGHARFGVAGYVLRKLEYDSRRSSSPSCWRRCSSSRCASRWSCRPTAL